MNVFAVSCLASWYDDWSSEFLGVCMTLDKAREVYKTHLKDSTRKCISSGGIYTKEFRCNSEIYEVELDGKVINYHDYEILERSEV